MPAHRPDSWSGLAADIRSCDACRAAAAGHVGGDRPILVSPDPPDELDLLFVGVAPTALEGRNRGAHFHSSRTDELRCGLFRELDRLLPPGPGGSLSESNSSGLERGNAAFRGERFHFVHACQACPVRDDAPPREAIALCLERHFEAVLKALSPRAICFLGKNNLSAAVSTFFGGRVDETPRAVALNGWSGLVAVAKQPRRGWSGDTRCAVAGLLRTLGRPLVTP